MSALTALVGVLLFLPPLVGFDLGRRSERRRLRRELDALEAEILAGLEP